MNTPELEVLRWLLQQGPGSLMLVLWGPSLLLLGVVLYFYRRDFVRILNREVEKSAVLVTLVQENTTAQAKAAASTDANNQAVERLTALLDRMRIRERERDDRGDVR